MKKHLSLLGFIFLLFLSLATQQAMSFVGVGDKAPDFTLVSVDGVTIKLSDYAGKPVLLSFFHYN